MAHHADVLVHNISRALVARGLVGFALALPACPFMSADVPIPPTCPQKLQALGLIEPVDKIRGVRVWRTTRRWSEWREYLRQKGQSTHGDDYDLIHQLYWDLHKTQAEIGEILGCDDDKVSKIMRSLGIKARSGGKCGKLPKATDSQRAVFDEEQGRYVMI